MTYQCQIQSRDAQPAVTVRTTCSVQELSSLLGQTYGRLMQYLGQAGQQAVGPPFVAYHNDDMDALDVEIGFPVAEALPGEGEVQPGEMPGGEFATCMHVGPYDQVGGAYEALSAWMEEQGHTLGGPWYEVYLNDPQDTPPDQLQTLVMCPVA